MLSSTMATALFRVCSCGIRPVPYRIAGVYIRYDNVMCADIMTAVRHRHRYDCLLCFFVLCYLTFDAVPARNR